VQIRESPVSELPPSHMYVGRTTLSLADIRAYSKNQRMVYELHRWAAVVDHV
jgi:hypothetical protein